MISPRVALSRYAALLAVLVIAALAALPVHTALAVSPAQETGEATPISLGEFVFRAMANGESATYQVSLPESAAYRITALDEERAAAFDLVVTDADDNEVYSDIFETVELDLEAGDITLQFIAVDNESLEFAVFGYLGTMSDDPDQPGALLPGSIYFESRVNEERYALLTIPETPYPQQVFLYIEPGEGDSFDLTAQGPDIGSAYLRTEENNLLHFWSQGGEYLITALPIERRSEFSLIPYLSGAPAVLALETPFEADIAAGQTEVVYELTLDAPYETLTISAETSADPISVTLVDRLYDGVYYESADWEGPDLTVENIEAGTYYVIVEIEPAEEDVPLTLLASGSAGGPVITRASGGTVTGLFEEGDTLAVFEFEVTKPRSLVTVQLASDAEDTDFDLQVGMDPDLTTWNTYTFGSDDVLSFIAPVAGTYYVGVRSNDYTGEFAVTFTEGGVAPALTPNDLTWGSVEGGQRALYLLEVTDPGDFLTVALVGQTDADLDLYISGYSADGASFSSVSGTSIGSDEIVSTLLSDQGIYEIAVSAEYADEGGNFVLLSRLEDPNLVAGQWAVSAAATSQYGEEGYSAMQAAGAPDTPAAGDQDTAWAPEATEAGEQTLELTYEHAVFPTAVRIFESYNPGAVIRIEAFDADGDAWVTLWKGQPEQPEEEFRVFSPELAEIDFAVDTIRIVLDTDAIESWNEIDAVELVGRP